MHAPIVIGGQTITPGDRVTLDLVVGKLYTHNEVTMPVHVIHGKENGPTLFVSAAIHGDEITGVEIIRRLLKNPAVKKIKGTLLAVPIVNVHGFINKSRYLPDRRDLNRCFPGSKSGSLAARIANLFMEEIVSKATHGIDLHSGAIHRDNFPQIRADLDDRRTMEMAMAFGIPVIINSEIPNGSLRGAAMKLNIPAIVYEAGEALRFDELSARHGVSGILRVMQFLGMLPTKPAKSHKQAEPFIARASTWVRTPDAGILRAKTRLGARVQKNDLLGIIADPFGGKEIRVTSPHSGIVIGMNNLPLVNEGEALFHIARFDALKDVAAKVEELQELAESDDTL
jgi:predicted deacylase